MADRLKAWEQNWQAHGREVRDDPRADWVVARMSSPADLGDKTAPTAEDRAKLASAAPDMARVLLAIEWIEYEHCSICPVCNMTAELHGHNPDCALDAALRKAGVR